MGYDDSKDKKIIKGLSGSYNSLVFKLPEEKDPCICVCFQKEFEAQKTNEDLIEKWSHDVYTVKLMPTTTTGTLINLMLLSDNNQRLYKNLSFNYQKLSWWLKHTEHSELLKFKFCHIISKHNKDVVAKTYNSKKVFVLTVSKCVVHDMNDLAF